MEPKDVTEEDLDEVIEEVAKQKDSQPEEVLTDPSALEQFEADMNNLYWS